MKNVRVFLDNGESYSTEISNESSAESFLKYLQQSPFVREHPETGKTTYANVVMVKEDDGLVNRMESVRKTIKSINEQISQQ